MSAGEKVWPLVRELATALDGNRESSERTLDALQTELRELSRGARDEIRRQTIQIVAALSRLEVRMIDTDGPTKTIV
jgi:hypothetical protein